MTTGFRLSTDRRAMDLATIHRWLSTSYWSPGIPQAIVARAIAGSVCIGAFDDGGAQIGFARAVSDGATFAWLADVFVAESARGRGVASAMVAALHAEPSLQGLRRWMLVTRDAHDVYARLGWQPIAEPGRFMERVVPDIYRRPSA